MAQELPYQTYERLTGKKWSGGTSQEIVKLLNLYGITATPGSAEANLELQRRLLQGGIPQQPTQATQPTQTIEQPNQNLVQQQQTENVIAKEPRDVIKPTQDYRIKLEDILKEQENLIEEQKRKQREDALALLEARLAEIDNYLNQKKAGLSQQEEAEKARASAIALRSGLAGSPFGESYVRNVEKTFEQERSLEEQQAAARKNAIRAEVEGALTNIENRYKEALLGVKTKRAEYLQEISKRALEDFKTLAKAPSLNFAQIKANRDLMKALVEQTGYDEDMLEFLWATERKGNDIEGFNTKIENGVAFSTWYDKATGEVKSKTFPIEGVKSGNYDVKIAGNNLLLIPKEVNSKDDIIIHQLPKQADIATSLSNLSIQRDPETGRYILFDKLSGSGRVIDVEGLNKESQDTIEQIKKSTREKLPSIINVYGGPENAVSKKNEIIRTFLEALRKKTDYKTIDEFRANNPVYAKVIEDEVERYFEENYPEYNKQSFIQKFLNLFK